MDKYFQVLGVITILSQETGTHLSNITLQVGEQKENEGGSQKQIMPEASVGECSVQDGKNQRSDADHLRDPKKKVPCTRYACHLSSRGCLCSKSVHEQGMHCSRCKRLFRSVEVAADCSCSVEMLAGHCQICLESGKLRGVGITGSITDKDHM